MRLMSEPGILLLLLSCKLLTPTSGNLQVLRALPSRLSASRSTPRCRSRTPGPPLPSPLRDSPHSLPRSPPIASPGRSLPPSSPSLPPSFQTLPASASPSLPRLPACTSLALPDNSRLSARTPRPPSLSQASLSPSPPSGPHRSQPPPHSPFPQVVPKPVRTPLQLSITHLSLLTPHRDRLSPSARLLSDHLVRETLLLVLTPGLIPLLDDLPPLRLAQQLDLTDPPPRLTRHFPQHSLVMSGHPPDRLTLVEVQAVFQTA